MALRVELVLDYRSFNCSAEMTANEFRKMALEIPAAVEGSHMHHPDFRIAGKIFASLGVPDENWGMVKLTPEQQGRFIENAPDVFKPCSGTWGRQGATNVHLRAAKRSLVRNALDAATKNVVGAAKKTKASARAWLPRKRVLASTNLLLNGNWGIGESGQKIASA